MIFSENRRPLFRGHALESAIPVLLSGQAKLRADFDEVDVQTLLSVTIIGKALASQVFKVYPPALFVRRIGREVMPSAWLSPANSSDVMPDLRRQIVDVARIPGLVLADGAALRTSRNLAAKQDTQRQ